MASIMYYFYFSLHQSGIHTIPWLGRIKDLFDRLGFSYLWDSQAQDLEFSVFKSIVSQTEVK